MSQSPPDDTHDSVVSREAVMLACERFLGRNPPRWLGQVMAELAEVTPSDEGPDRYGQGNVVESFEREMADLLGKEAALFFPSGTMAQQIALRIWSDRRRSKTVAFHPTCHVETHEHKAYQVLHGLHGRLVAFRAVAGGLIRLCDRSADGLSRLRARLDHRTVARVTSCPHGESCRFPTRGSRGQ